MNVKNNTAIFIVGILAVSTFALVIVLANAVSPTSYGTQYLIGMSQSNHAQPYRAQMNEDIKLASSAYNNIKVVMTDARQSNEKQIEDIQYLMDIGIDLLIVSPNETEPLNDIISHAYKNIPVIVLDRKISTDNYTLFIGADNYKIGFQVGEQIASVFAGRHSNIVEIRGLPGSTATDERSQGFYDAIKNNTNFTISKTITGDWLRDVAEDRMVEYLLSDDFNNPIDAVFAHNDAMAHGGYNAFSKLGKRVEYIIGIDGLEGFSGGQDLVQLNILDVTFVYPTGGEEAIEYALRILNGEKFENKYIELKTKMVKK